MSRETELLEVPSDVAATAVAAPELDQDAIARALSVIQLDSLLQPEQYLADALVPHGGE